MELTSQENVQHTRSKHDLLECTVRRTQLDCICKGLSLELAQVIVMENFGKGKGGQG